MVCILQQSGQTSGSIGLAIGWVPPSAGTGPASFWKCLQPPGRKDRLCMERLKIFYSTNLASLFSGLLEMFDMVDGLIRICMALTGGSRRQ
jgi:hypothetical protein